MKNLLITLVALIVSVTANAQIGSQLIDRATPIDTAKYKVTYSLQYKYHPDIRDYETDTRIVQIGKRVVKDYSEIINHFDSLATEQIRRGADSFSNISGNPWPLEITRDVRGGNADVNYRMPMMCDNLVYHDSVPSLNWQFSPDEGTQILGYECAKATCDFSGRTYTAWFATEIPLPYGPYKFGGLPGLILKIEDAERQFVWEAIGFERSNNPIMKYSYQNVSEKRCSAEDAAKTIERYFKSPYIFTINAMGGDPSRMHVMGKDGKRLTMADMEKISIPYKPLEIK